LTTAASSFAVDRTLSAACFEACKSSYVIHCPFSCLAHKFPKYAVRAAKRVEEDDDDATSPVIFLVVSCVCVCVSVFVNKKEMIDFGGITHKAEHNHRDLSKLQRFGLIAHNRKE
jgi:hypothetical protein